MCSSDLIHMTNHSPRCNSFSWTASILLPALFLVTLGSCGQSDLVSTKPATSVSAKPTNPTNPAPEPVTTDAVNISGITASASEANNPPSNVSDGKLTTRWSAGGDGQWIRLDLGQVMTVGAVKIAWFKGSSRQAKFDVQTSSNGNTYTNVLTNKISSGRSEERRVGKEC